VKNGILLAEEDINARGGIDGKRVDIIFEDDKCDPKEAVSSFEKLSQTDGVKAIVGPFCSGSVLSAASKANQENVVLLSPGGAAPEITAAGDFVFRVVPSDVLQARELASRLEARNITSIALLVSNVAQSTGMRDAMAKAFHGTIVDVEMFEDGAADMRTQLEKIKKAGPQALVIFTYPQNYPTITKQIVELDLLKDLQAPLFATHTFETPASLKMGKDAEAYVYTIHSMDRSRPKAKEFMDRYEKRFGEKPMIWAAYAYDATVLLAEASSACKGSKDGACIKDHLYSTNDADGVTGLIRFDSNGDRPSGFYDFKQVRDGKFVMVS